MQKSFYCMDKNIVRMPLHICPAIGIRYLWPWSVSGVGIYLAWLPGPLWGGRPGYSREGGQVAIYKLAHESFSYDLLKNTAIYLSIFEAKPWFDLFFIESLIRPLHITLGLVECFLCCCKSCCPCSYSKETLGILTWGTSPGMWRRPVYVRQPFVLESESILICCGPVHSLLCPTCFSGQFWLRECELRTNDCQCRPKTLHLLRTSVPLFTFTSLHPRFVGDKWALFQLSQRQLSPFSICFLKNTLFFGFCMKTGLEILHEGLQTSP